VKGKIREIAGRIREREMMLWKSKTSKPMGAFAIAMMLDGFATDLEIAIGDMPPPRGRDSKTSTPKKTPVQGAENQPTNQPTPKRRPQK